MTHPIAIPSVPSSSSSPSASSDSGEPRTPDAGSPIDLSENNSTAGASSSSANTAGGKRKSSRRANTAERRATHNAVERQRRETLNGRFLDLAKLLPNLSQIRRPSKSAIVNSSIAHVHASRRHRALASRELRLLKTECDHIRRELNEWRDRAGIPRVEEPVRGEGFGMVLSGELEIIPVLNGPADEDDDDMYAEQGSFEHEVEPGAIGVEEQARMAQAHYRPPVPPVNTSSFAPQAPPPFNRTHSNPHPMIASPTGMSFDNPILGVYDSHVPLSTSGQMNVNMNPYPNYDKYSSPIPPQQGFNGRGRSGSMTSSGSASPPHHQPQPHVTQARPYHQGQAGWGGMQMQNYGMPQMNVGGNQPFGF
ncbi:macrophage erythroblast attacher isoform 1 [Moniliophthora roreri MCA 2997]|uniref:Macrophage erythroblast attacher isoform 1 n=1 Tax=Moniliophthora roreri (strain MCA 2997) TaxID=1381753 RepID=V2XGG8_MONRO|nr:macrophage erythroblast attacher isoform 1 [Moniliophthora roreri MCA 2997]